MTGRAPLQLRYHTEVLKSDFLLALTSIDTQIIIAAQINFVVGRLFGVFINIDVKIVIAQVRIGDRSILLWRFIERQWLFRLQDRLGHPDVPA
jgi:hypothetical protein